MRIVITDCDHDAFEQERAVVAASGDELVIANSLTPGELIASAEGADALVVQYASITGEILDALPNVKVVSRYGVGVDSVDIPAATERGIAVCNVPDYGTEAVSDHAIALAMNAAREVTRLDRGLRAGVVDFPGVRPMHLVGERVFGIVGLGLIGSATARKAAGLGFQVICHDILAGDADEFRGYPHVSLDELLRRSQVVSIHTPLTELTHHLIDADALASMRPDAILVNTARGPIVDTAALGEALRAGTIRGAALDVTETEPLPADDPLLELPQLTVTPHMAWYSEESYGELKRRTVENAADLIAGRVPRNIINPEVLGAPGRNRNLDPGASA
ncbi:C-terminal binding protein [Propioniciclava coleopterorum]|uniref:C-terminal binding protein n=1 Tax=Propioniciclava coleopterorum TaxID=2714937 RepID=A0A6G7Y7B9_9ACTN|nr:C-terminal binding protein [Propioniciclava coleopterorum]QIK72712.1 C-terminal binding protein [Propioniciclava coleopterorum]